MIVKPRREIDYIIETEMYVRKYQQTWHSSSSRTLQNGLNYGWFSVLNYL